MADTDDEVAPGGEPAAVFTADSDVPMSVTDAANAITRAREAPVTEKEPDEEAPPSPPAAPDEPPAETDDTAPPLEAPGDTTEEAVPAVQLPPIEPPRSWSREDKEVFATLPRATQERTAQSWQARETDLNRRQQEAADQRQKAAQAQQQYEQALPNVLAAAQTQWNTEFPDIKSWADAEKLQQEDFVRYQRFDLVRQKANAARQELDAAARRQEATAIQEWAQYSRNQDAEFEKLAPEMADPVKAKALRDKAGTLMKEVGFTDDELKAALEGKAGFYVKDHRVQQIIRKAALWDMASDNAKKVRETPVPPVIKPGTSRSSTKGDADAAEITSIRKQMETASGRKSLELGARLQQLLRAAS